MNKPRPSISFCFSNKSSSERGCSLQVFSSDAHSHFLQEQNEHVLRDHSPLACSQTLPKATLPTTWNLGLKGTSRSAGRGVHPNHPRQWQSLPRTHPRPKMLEPQKSEQLPSVCHMLSYVLLTSSSDVRKQAVSQPLAAMCSAGTGWPDA